MRLTDSRLLVTLLVACLLGPSPVFATDVDGPNDCNRAPVDFGDAPESVPAGKLARSASNAVNSGRSFPVTVLERCMTWL